MKTRTLLVLVLGLALLIIASGPLQLIGDNIQAQADLAVDPDPDEPNDTCAQAKYLGQGYFTFHTSSDIDWYLLTVFSANVGMYVFAGGDGDCLVEVYRADCQTLIRSGVNGAELLPWEDGGAGDYYVRVAAVGGWTGEYRLNGEPSYYGCIEGHVYRAGTQIGVAGAQIGMWYYNWKHMTDYVLFYSATTDWTGAFKYCRAFAAYDGGEYKVKEDDPPGYTSAGADILSGQVINLNEVYFSCISGMSGCPALIHFYDTPPIGLGVQPASGKSCAGSVQLFTTSYADAASVSQITAAEFMLDAGDWMAGAVRLQYNPSWNGICLRDETNSGWTACGAPGSAQILQSRFVRVHLDRCSVVVNPDGKTLAVAWALEFQPAFAGSYNLFVLAAREGEVTVGWEGLGDWTVEDCTTPRHWLSLPLILRRG